MPRKQWNLSTIWHNLHWRLYKFHYVGVGTERFSSKLKNSVLKAICNIIRGVHVVLLKTQTSVTSYKFMVSMWLKEKTLQTLLILFFPPFQRNIFQHPVTFKVLTVYVSPKWTSQNTFYIPKVTNEFVFNYLNDLGTTKTTGTHYLHIL